MAENFNLIFGSSASQSYSWNDSDYQNGWQTVGDTPPTREQFDALQRRADLKSQELNDRLAPIEENDTHDYRQPSTTYTAGQIKYHATLPTGWYLECTTAGTTGAGDLVITSPSVGGTVSDGTVVWTVQSIVDNIAPKLSTILDDCNNVKDGTYRTNSATQNKPTNDAVLLAVKGFAGNGTQSLLQIASSLDGLGFYNRGFNDGDMTWGPWIRHEQIVAKSLGTNGYIKYTSGLILQWGALVVNGVSSVTYPISFSHTGQVMAIPVNSTQNIYATINTTSLSGCTIKHSLGAQDAWCNWLAIGY